MSFNSKDNSRTDVFRDVISLIINQCGPGDRREPPADTKCPPGAQRKQAKRACIYIYIYINRVLIVRIIIIIIIINNKRHLYSTDSILICSSALYNNNRSL